MMLVGSARAAGLLAVALIAVAASNVAEARECRVNYYKCDLNRGGRIDPDNPGCCWSPAAGKPHVTACPRNFYKCDLNRGGRVDPAHPGCCWNLRTD